MTKCCQHLSESDHARERLIKIGWPEHKWNGYKNWELEHLVPIMRDVPILDVGCTTSMPLEVALHLGYKSLRAGIDLDLNHGLWTIDSGCEISKASGSNIPYPDKSFGIVCCCSVYEHLDESDKVQFIKEAVRVLNVGGNILLTIDFWPDGRNGSVSSDGIKRLFSQTQGSIEWEDFDESVSDLTICGLYTMAALRGIRI